MSISNMPMRLLSLDLKWCWAEIIIRFYGRVSVSLNGDKDYMNDIPVQAFETENDSQLTAEQLLEQLTYFPCLAGT